MNANVYQHFRKDEHPFIDIVWGLARASGDAIRALFDRLS